jgi:ring-1,2-phenylacetyl-CoA epoxidase subunit PaaD
MDVIALDIKLKLSEAGFKKIKVISILSPAWTTDWMSEAGKEKLSIRYRPPNAKQVCHNDLFAPNEAVQCPHCNSYHTSRISEFDQQPARHYINAKIAKNRLIILNAKKLDLLI